MDIPRDFWQTTWPSQNIPSDSCFICFDDLKTRATEIGIHHIASNGQAHWLCLDCFGLLRNAQLTTNMANNVHPAIVRCPMCRDEVLDRTIFALHNALVLHAEIEQRLYAPRRATG